MKTLPAVRSSLRAIAAALTLTITITLLATQARAEGRLITVNGDADVRVPPDEVNITLGVEAGDKELVTAARKNSDQVKQVVAMAKEFRIEAKDIGTDQLTLDKQTEYVNGKNIFKEYVARRTVSLKLKDLSRFEELLIAAMRGGATSISGVQFCTSQLRRFRDQARAQALKAASEKASDMAKTLGQRVGKPHTITENYDGWSAWSRHSAGNYGNVQNVVQSGGGGASAGDTPAVGLITINARVTVAFELE